MRAERANLLHDVFARKSLYLAVAAALLAPGAIFAQEEQSREETIRELTTPAREIEVGAGYVSRDSFKFGDYTGLKNEGSYLIGNIDWLQRDRQTGSYWSLNGTNLGLRSRNLRLEFGEQGNYGFAFEYDQLPKFRTESAKTIFDGAGGTVLTLPAGWVGATTTAGMTQLNSSLKPLDISHERKNYIGEFSKILTREWSLKANFRHETKEGTKIVGAVIGNSGGNPRSVLIPEPIDYETNQFEALLQYAGDKAQLQVGYYMSLFNNQNTSLIWQNPFTAIAGWAPAAGFPTGQGQLGLPPDNQFHQLLVTGGYNFSQTTRLTAHFQYGRMLQDQAFLPYTVNPALVVTTPLPRASADARIDNTLLNLNLTSRPLPKLNLRASYRYDDRDNKTPQAQYIYIGGDSQDQATTLASDRVRTNLPISYRQNLIRLGGDYEVFNRTKLNAGYDYEEIKRTFAEVQKTREHTYQIGLRRGFSETVNGGVSFAHSDRKNKGYDSEAPFNASYSPQYIATLPAGGQFDNHPLLRKFNYADRDRDRIRLSVNATPHELVSLQFRADYNRDDYDNSILGLTDSRSESYTLDASFTPRSNLAFYAFYTYDNIKSNQTGRSFTSANKVALATPLTSPNDWFVAANDRVDTIGVGFKLTGISGRLDIGADYIYSHAVGSIDVATGSALTSAPVPDFVSRLNSVQLYGKYKIDKNGSLKLSFWHQKLHTADWAFDNVTPTTLANVITTGQLSPNYSVNVLGISYSYRYW
jgi:MtrB/PioB family decaheme-associated outer membrane protein